MKSEWLQNRAGRQEGVAGRSRASSQAQFLLISSIVPFSFVFTAGCSLLPTWRMKTCFLREAAFLSVCQHRQTAPVTGTPSRIFPPQMHSRPEQLGYGSPWACSEVETEHSADELCELRSSGSTVLLSASTRHFSWLSASARSLLQAHHPPSRGGMFQLTKRCRQGARRCCYLPVPLPSQQPFAGLLGAHTHPCRQTDISCSWQHVWSGNLFLMHLPG